MSEWETCSLSLRFFLSPTLPFVFLSPSPFLPLSHSCCSTPTRMTVTAMSGSCDIMKPLARDRQEAESPGQPATGCR